MFQEKPPMLSGNQQADLVAMRDYLFRLASGLNDVALSSVDTQRVTYDSKGRATVSTEAAVTIDQIRKNATELRDLIIKSADEVTEYVDSKTEEYNSMYVAQSDYGTFVENINTTIENTARGVVESYNYQGTIDAVSDAVSVLQSYMTNINGEIRRGVVLDPSTNEYVTGIAIAQSLRFQAEMSGGAAAALPDDGYVYYELSSGQTFGLYTSTGWQFWIDGYKKGWFNSEDGMLHVANVYIENILQIGDSWQVFASVTGDEFEIKYIGV